MTQQHDLEGLAYALWRDTLFLAGYGGDYRSYQPMDDAVARGELTPGIYPPGYGPEDLAAKEAALRAQDAPLYLLDAQGRSILCEQCGYNKLAPICRECGAEHACAGWSGACRQCGYAYALGQMP